MRGGRTWTRSVERLAAAAGPGSGRELESAASPSSTQGPLVAYVAHELRGPIALQRALVEVALADPDADVAALREMGERILAGCEEQQQRIETLLALARSQHGLVRREPVDISAVSAESLRAHADHDLTSSTLLEPARTVGDSLLIERLVANLIANAVRHNVPGGRVELSTYTTGDRAMLTVANTGPVVPPAELIRLFRPFERLAEQPGMGSGGLGLALVQAIASAHDALVTARARSGGGLRIDVGFFASTGVTRM